jgi:hypothetical protein
MAWKEAAMGDPKEACRKAKRLGLVDVQAIPRRPLKGILVVACQYIHM